MTPPNAKEIPKIGLFSATLIVVANMIGAGVFSLSGELGQILPSHFGILLAWLIGGVMAFCGAATYGELSSHFTRSGGEYNFLSRIYSPALGFISGFVSIVVGFSASIALNAFQFAEYLKKVFTEAPPFGDAFVPVVAVGIVGIISLIHAVNVMGGVAFQNSFVLLKVALILLFIVAGIFALSGPEAVEVSIVPTSADWDLVFSSSFAGGLIQVFYAYLGWNAAVYITGEVKEPRKNVPRALLLGALTVTALYLLVNFAFLRSVPLDKLSGNLTIGALSAQTIFGSKAAAWLSLLIAFALASSISSMVMAGPRVTQTMGEDFRLFRVFSVRKAQGGPYLALALQFGVAAALLLTSTFGQILGYIGFTLSIFAMLSVAGIYFVRFKHGKPKDAAPALGYPVAPAIFILLSLWMIYSSLGDLFTAGAGIATLVVGYLIYIIASNSEKR